MKLFSGSGKRGAHAAPGHAETRKEKRKTQTKPVAERTEKTTGKNTASKKPLFYKAAITGTGIIILCVCIGLSVFWKYIEAYEASLPNHPVSAFMDSIDYDFWEGQVKNAIISSLTEFERDRAEEISAKHLAALRDASFVIRQKTDECTEDLLVYVLRAGARDIGIIRLSPAGDAGFGFTLWEISSVEYISSYTDNLAGSIEITASQNAAALVNGISVGQQYLTDCEVQYGKTYRIEGIYGGADAAEVSVTQWDGTPAEPYYAEDGFYYFDIIIPFSAGFDIIVPEGAGVLAGSEEIETWHIIERNILPGIFEGIPEFVHPPPLMERYAFTIDEIYQLPEITVIDPQGRKLRRDTDDEGRDIYSPDYSGQYKELYSQIARDFIDAYVRYSINAGATSINDNNNVMKNYGAVNRFLRQGSDIQERMFESITGVLWNSGFSVTYNSLEIDNFIVHSDYYFSCLVSYDMTTVNAYTRRDDTGTYELLFILIDDDWLVERMIVSAK